MTKEKTTKTTKAKASTLTGSKNKEITWSADIAHTRHHWWWYLAIVWVGWTLSLVLIAFGNWSAALVTAVAAVGLVVINVGGPRKWRVTVDGTTVIIKRPGNDRFRYTRSLDKFRAFTVVQMPATKRDREQSAIALLARRRLGGAQLLVLPYDTQESSNIIERLSTYISYEPDASFGRSDLVLSRVARWLGLS